MSCEANVTDLPGNSNDNLPAVCDPMVEKTLKIIFMMIFEWFKVFLPAFRCAQHPKALQNTPDF